MRLIRYVYLVVMEAFYTFLADDGWAIASHIALSTLMALFPFLIVLTALAGFFGSKELADQAADLLLQVWPKRVADAISGEIHDVRPPVDNRLAGTSSWVNLATGRDKQTPKGWHVEA